MTLYKALYRLRLELSQAAQKVYDRWEQDDDGIDDELGSGGICDIISDELAGVIASKIPNVEVTQGGQDGDDHAFLIAYNDDEACAVDIPPSVYETGRGYNWKKLSDVEITTDDIIIEKLDRNDFDFDSYAELLVAADKFCKLAAKRS